MDYNIVPFDVLGGLEGYKYEIEDIYPETDEGDYLKLIVSIFLIHF
jgi:hypothetical protein